MIQIIKHLKNNFTKQAFVSLTGVLAISIAIWFMGPDLKLGKYVPLAQSYARLFAITLLLANWVFKTFIGKGKLKLSTSTIKALPLSLKNSLQDLKSGKAPLAQLPWYLLIGPQRAGKTALLSNSNIDFVKNSLELPAKDSAGAAENFDCWVTAENVILDVPGSYLYNAEDSNASQQSLPEFFNKKSGRKQPVRGIIVALPLSDLIKRETRLEFAETLKRRITELQGKFGRNLPFFFTITKCDLLPGFMDFFNNSGTDELGQAWGITIPNLSVNDSLVDVFTQRFNALIKRLNKQLIWRLHQEMGSFERVFIKDFPLQVERLKEMLIDILKTLSGIQNTFSLQGVYLTSATQHPAQEQIIQPHLIANASHQALQIMQTPAMPTRSYFIRQFLAQGLLGNSVQAPKIWQRRPAVYALCASTIAITIVFLGYDLFYGKGKDKTIEVASFNIVVPQDKPQETKVGDSLTIVG